MGYEEILGVFWEVLGMSGRVLDSQLDPVLASGSPHVRSRRFKCQMDKSLIPLLAEMLELYYDYHELTEMASIFDVSWTGDIFAGNQFRWITVSRQLVER